MAETSHKGGKKNRKHGRNKVRGQAKRYLVENRLERNKAKRARKQARIVAQHAAKCLRVPHGTARAARRASMQPR